MKELTYSESTLRKNLLAVLTAGIVVLSHLLKFLIVRVLELSLTLIDQLFHLAFRTVEDCVEVVFHDQFSEELPESKLLLLNVLHFLLYFLNLWCSRFDLLHEFEKIVEALLPVNNLLNLLLFVFLL